MPGSALNAEDTALLSSLLGVSDISNNDRPPDSGRPAWVLEDVLDISGTEVPVVLRPALLAQCPRCWKYQADEANRLCQRCGQAVHT